MSFSSGTYEFYLIFSKTTAGKEPWKRDEWNTLYEPVIRKLINLSPESSKTGIRVLEYAKKEETDPYMAEVKLGRLKWDEASHNKWTLGEDDKRQFAHVESWTPIWTVCEKREKAPDVYISIFNEKNHAQNDNIEFDLFMVIALAQEMHIQAKDIILELSKLLQARITVSNIRTWGKGKTDPKGAWKFDNWIQDTISFGIYKKDLLQTPFDTVEFEPYWEIIYTE